MTFNIDFGKLSDPEYQGQAFSQVNNLTQKLVEQVTCDKQCQFDRKAESLKKKLDRATELKKKAPTMVKNAEKNYYVFVKGEPYYEDMLESRFAATAQEMKRKFLEKHKKQMEFLREEVQNYESATIYEENMRDLWKQYEKEEKELALKTKKLENVINVSDREAAIQDNEVNSQTNVHKIFFVIYYFCVFVFLVFIVAKKRYNEPLLWLAFVVLLFFPYVKAFLLSSGTTLKDKIKAYFSNVYLEENDVSNNNIATSVN